MRGYTVSKDTKSGAWYAHMRGFPNIPVFGSISEKKSTASEYAKMMNGLPNKVEQIEAKRHKEMDEWLES